MRKRIQKYSLVSVVFIFLSVTVFGNLALVQPARAQLPVTETSSIPQALKIIWDQIYESVKAALITAGVRATSYAIRKVAYDSAVWVASGGKGQNPLAHTKGFGGYLNDIKEETAGVFIEDMSKSAGVDLCKIPDIKVDLALKVGLRTKFVSGPPAKPACTLQTFTKNWSSGEAWSKYTDKNKLLKNFNASITADDSDLGIYFQATEKINNKVTQQNEAAIYNRVEGGGFKPLTTLISDQIKTPAKNIAETAQALNPTENFKKSEEQLNAALASGDAKVFPAVLSMFLSTLGGTIINNFQTKGILPFGICVAGQGGDWCKRGGSTSLSGDAANPLFNSSGEGITSLGRTAAQSFFSYLTSVKIRETNKYDLVSQLNSCPDSPGVFNCRAGDDLINAAGQGITILDAINKGILDGNKKLISPSSQKFSQLNNDINCYQSAYCYNNVKVLRQVRVLPIGFEIAVQNSDINIPWTLKQVVDGFNVCPATSTEFNPELHKFCHLIDPNWVLKVPQAKCNALVTTASLLSQDVPTRMQDCVDLQTCVQYSSDGNCSDYAYCTKEKNTWKFSADSCDSQYATCRTFENAAGRAVSFLTRTLDNGYCTQSNAGCTAFSLTQNGLGKWMEPSFDSSRNLNNGIFLNQSVDSSCSAQSAGCSAFQIASSNSEDLLYLKKAPDYLRCYDSNPLTTSTVEWPQTVSDLNRIQGRPECSNFAKACIPEEASCNWYTALNGSGSRVPGKFTPATVTGNTVVWNDQCDARCSGYNVYKEMPSNYSNGVDLAYIIPSSGKSCLAEDEGCSSFTNLNTAIGGVENVEYYSYLRPCITMQEASSTAAKTFITYEGSKENGFQLRTYLMRTDTTGASDPAGIAGGPQYFYKDQAQYNELKNECTEQRYKDGVASLDCRQFNDQNGRIYYRMISHTIPAHEQCTGYRLNNPEFYTDTTIGTPQTCQDRLGYWNAGQCQLCVQNGEYKNGACVYEGVPKTAESTAGNSRSCSVEMNTCRAYKGNAGNNVQTVFTENFESVSSSVGWSGAVNVVAVSTRVGEHSLEFNQAGVFEKTLDLEIGKSYDLTFWASAGRASNVTVSIQSGATSNNLGVISVGGVWREYHLGPIELKGTNSNVQLRFNHNLSGALYIDNIKMVKVASYLYLVKDSLKVDPICDSHPEDNLPGEALGCTAYSDPQNRTFYLTNFSYLCREDSIGCTELRDTYNTQSALPDAYRVWIPGTPGLQVTRMVGADEYKCQVENKSGQNGCYVDIKGHSSTEILAAIPGGFVTSTVYIPADTATSSPVYLIANKAGSCNQSDFGCSLAGMLQFTSTGWQYITTTIKNSPNTYQDTLCESQASGCRAFADGTENYYFKDPAVSGQNSCAFKTDVPYAAVGTTTIKRVTGWFLKDPTGTCSNNPSIICTKNSSSTPCGLGNFCQDQPCYPSYTTSNDGEFGVYSYGSPFYDNYVAECNSDQDKCTEYQDHADNVMINNRLVTKSYFLKKDEKVTSGDCNGQVSQKNGCALLDEVSNPTKMWNTTSTYALSNSLGGVYVTPSSSALTNDANVIMKVVQDRECGEWLKCQFSFSTFNEQTNSYEPKCRGNLQRLTVDPTDPRKDMPVPSVTNILTPDTYRYRPVGWYDLDYDGYSILGMYPIEILDQVNFATSSDVPPDMRLVRKINCAPGIDVNCATIGSGISTVCGGTDPTNGAPCGPATSPGICVNNTCYQNMSGTSITPIKQICRAFPELDSPFPNTDKLINSSYFKGANICNTNSVDGTGKSCECDYQKVLYGDTMYKYFNPTDVGIFKDRSKTATNRWATNTAPPYGICFGGTVTSGAPPAEIITQMDGTECLRDSECGDGGVCQKMKRKNNFVGWRGFCLEEDTTRHLNGEASQNTCLTWFPVESLAGAPDINNQHTEAASDWQTSNAASGGYYCISGRGSTDTVSFDINFSPAGINATDRVTATDPTYGPAAYALVARRCRNRACFSNVWTQAFQFARAHVNPASPGTKITVPASNPIALQNIRTEDIESVTITVLNSSGNENVANNTSVTFPNLPVVNPASPLLQPYYQVQMNNNNPLGAFIGGFYPNYGGNFVSYFGPLADDMIVSRDMNLDLNNNTINEMTVDYGFGGPKNGVHGSLVYDSSLPLYALNTSNQPVDIWSTTMPNDARSGSNSAGTLVLDPITGSPYQRVEFYLLGSQAANYDANVNVVPNVAYTCDPDDPTQYPGDTCTNGPHSYYYDVSMAQDDGAGGLILSTIRVLSTTSSPILSPNPTTTLSQSRVVLNPLTGQPVTLAMLNMDSDQLSLANGTVPGGWGACRVYDQQPYGRSYLGRGPDTYNQWHALRLTFDPATRLFNGIDTAFCGAQHLPGIDGEWQTGRYQDKVSYRVTIKLRRWCSSYADGRYDPIFGGSPKVLPWTDHLFNVPNSSYQQVPGITPIISYASTSIPYGSLGSAPIGTASPVVLDAPAASPCPVSGIYTAPSGQTLACTAWNAKYDMSYVRTGQRFSVTTDQDGVNRLTTLFSSYLNPYAWRRSGSWQYSIDNTLSGNVTANGVAPQIHPLGSGVVNQAGQAVNYFELPALGFSVEGQVGDLQFEESSKSVSLDFFMYANENQMPIRKVTIDWDDGRTIVPAEGFFRNRRGYSGTPASPESYCKPPVAGANGAADYGSIVDRTCDNGFFHSENAYACYGANPVNYHPNPSDCGIGGTTKFPTGCCIFVPRVQVKDNWGWCNGTCSGAPGGNGCFDATWASGVGTDECDLTAANGWGSSPAWSPSHSTQGSWTPFGGRVIIKHN